MPNTTDNKSTPAKKTGVPTKKPTLGQRVTLMEKTVPVEIAGLHERADNQFSKLQRHKAKTKQKLATHSEQIKMLRKDVETLTRKSRGTTSAHHELAAFKRLLTERETAFNQLSAAVEKLGQTPTTSTVGLRIQEAELDGLDALIDSKLGDLPEVVGQLKVQVNELVTTVNNQGDHINLVVAGHNQLDQRVSRLQQLREKFPWTKFAIAAIIGVLAGLIYWTIDQTLSVQLNDGTWHTFSSPQLNDWPVTIGFGIAAFTVVFGILLLIPSRGDGTTTTTSTAVPAYGAASPTIPVATEPLPPVTSPSYPGAEASTEPVMAQGASRTH